MDNFHGLAVSYHAALPERIRAYLNARGIADEVIDRHLLGWNGSRITIPIPNVLGEIAFFKLARDPADLTDSPKMLTTPGTQAELFGWERVFERPAELILCEGEFDRLVLETQGFAAATSTGGAGTFRREWAEALAEIPTLYVCFDRDDAGEQGVRRVARLLPRARIVRLPDEVGEGGDVTDFFVRLGRSRDDFLGLLQAAEPLRPSPVPPPERRGAPRQGETEAARLKALVPLEVVVVRYLELEQHGQTLRANCPFHDDRVPSFVLFPETNTFHCFGCGAHGDVLTFLMKIEQLTFPEALAVLKKLAA